MAKVGVVIGSKTDEPLIKPALELLGQMGIECETSVISAHRNPEKARRYATSAEGRGVEVIIAAAGYAAHLPGVLASWATIPVIGIPLPTSDLKGIDSLLSILQMPSGIPVAGVGIGITGAKNAALLAAQILSLKYSHIKKAYQDYRRHLSRSK